jgi:hypothetical protein
METFSGIKIRKILLHNQNWYNFFTQYSPRIRNSITINVCKILACRTKTLGFHLYTCNKCGNEKKVYHTCKSRFCSSCGKKATEQWIENNLGVLPNVPWQHITFTLPQELRDFFWLNRHLANHIVKITAAIINKLAKQKNLIPGIFAAIHTFGRDLKANVHFHVSITSGGLSLDHKKWIPDFYIHHQTIKNMWKQQVISTLRTLYKNDDLKLPPALQGFNSYTAFNSWLNFLYNKSWVVHLQKKSHDYKRNIKYLGRYLKRPPMAETRITKYDGKNVTYRFLDHHDKSLSYMTLPVKEFIKRLIIHIPDTNFRLIRYYNWLSNKTRSKLLPIVYELLKQVASVLKKISWRSMFQRAFGSDPIECQLCKLTMDLTSVTFVTKNNLLDQHKILATTIV